MLIAMVMQPPAFGMEFKNMNAEKNLKRFLALRAAREEYQKNYDDLNKVEIAWSFGKCSFSFSRFHLDLIFKK